MGKLEWWGYPMVKQLRICIIIIIINNKHDNVYGAVIMAEPLREFTRFI